MEAHVYLLLYRQACIEKTQLLEKFTGESWIRHWYIAILVYCGIA